MSDKDPHKTHPPENADPPSIATEPWVLRVVDANANRAAEGLRVVEEFLRFHLEDRSLSQCCKHIRHKVSKTVVGMFQEQELIRCRSTTTDVGVQTEGDNEYDRSTITDIVVSNLKRAEEALRVLEELAKIISVSAAKTFESQRYELYTLEKSLHHLLQATQALGSAQLYVLVDEHFGIETEFQTKIERLLQADIDVLQLRAKTITDRELADVSRWLAKQCRDNEVIFIVNDRPDIARAVNAHGVHVGQEELSVADARAVVGPRALIGVSTHSSQQAQQAVRDGADYIGVGPVFNSQTKSFEKIPGSRPRTKYCRPSGAACICHWRYPP